MSFKETWLLAAHGFAGLVEQLPADCWEAPGLGDWSIRDLVGHATSAGLSAVIDALESSAGREDITSPEGYYAFAKSVDREILEAAVVASTQDAREHGRRLGEEPAAAVGLVLNKAIARLDEAGGGVLIASAAGGMRLDAWLPTRTFELAVHTLDIARAASLPLSLPDAVIADTSALAARIATATGDGASVLLALTGRAPLPEQFSVV